MRKRRVVANAVFAKLLLFSFFFGFNVSASAEKQAEVAMRFGMQAVITAREGRGEALADIMLQASQIVAGLHGCQLYIVQRSLNNDNKILITEVWDSSDAHKASLTNEKVRDLISQAKPLIESMEHHPAQLMGGHGL